MKRLILTIGILLILVGQGWTATYYMRMDGSSANLASATSASAAATSISPTTLSGLSGAGAPQPGDTIVISNAGGAYDWHNWVIPSSGSAGGGYITYQGSGSPVIDTKISLDGYWTIQSGPTTYTSTASGVTNWMPLDRTPHNMTALNSPSPYVASASTTNTTYAAYKAFDGVLSNSGSWIGTGGGTDWLQLDVGSGNEFPCYGYWIYSNSSSNAPKTWTLKASNTGAFAGEEVTLDSQTNFTWQAYGAGTGFICSTPDGVSYRYYRLNITASTGAQVSVKEMGFASQIEIFKKIDDLGIFMLYEDGVVLNPNQQTSEANVLANFARGDYCFINGNHALYYRTSDGNAASTHALKGGCINNGSVALGFIAATSKSYLKFKDFSGGWYMNGGSAPNFIGLSACDHVEFDNVYVHESYNAMELASCTNITINSNCSFSNNYGDGLFVEGTGTDTINISGTFDNNGRATWYTNSAVQYGTSDRDCIGIGGTGGTIANIYVQDAIITRGGFPPGNTSASGSGLYVDTANAMTLTNMVVNRCYFSDNHYTSCYLGPKIVSGAFTNNIVNNASTAGGAGIYQAVVVSSGTNAGFTGFNVDNNTFAFNVNKAALYLRNPVTAGTLNFRNNIFYNNGMNDASWNGDVWIGDASISKIVESNNNFHRTAGAWGSTKLIDWNGAYYALNQIIGGAGNWQGDSGQGANDLISDPLFTNAGGSFALATDFKLQGLSPCINTGTNTGLTTDYAGAPRPQ